MSKNGTIGAKDDDLSGSLELLEAEVISEISLSGALIKEGYEGEAFDRLDRSLKRAVKAGSKQLQARIHRAYFERYENIGKLNDAVRHKGHYRKLLVEIYAQSESRLSLLKEHYDLELERLRSEQFERELTNSTLQLIAQTELLSELRDGLLQVIRKFPMPDGAAKELRERLKTLPCKAVDWEKFDTQFKSAHPEFTKKLIGKYPTLSPTELRICSLLRMNLKSEDIARLLCLSARSVEFHRYNIRKKLGLKTDQHLPNVLGAL